MPTLVVYCAISAFIGLVILGHISLLQAMFTSADHADGTREHRRRSGRRSVLPDVPV
jgi:hypothetical protein